MTEYFFIFRFGDYHKEEIGPFPSRSIAEKQATKMANKLQRKGAVIRECWIKMKTSPHGRIQVHLFDGYPESWDTERPLIYLEQVQGLMEEGMQGLRDASRGRVLPKRLIMTFACKDHPKAPLCASFSPGKTYINLSCNTCAKPIGFFALAPIPESAKE